MNTCKTCKWWGDESLAKQSNRRDCNCEKLDTFNNLDDGLNPVDAEGYSARIETGPDFGCVHWEGK